MLVAGVGAFDEVCAGVDLQHDVDDVLELEVVSVRTVPAAPAQVVAHLLLRDAFERVVQRFDADLAALAERLQPHLHADAVPKRRQPGVVHLEDDASVGDGSVLYGERFGEGVEVLLFRGVVVVAAVDLQARGGRRGEEYVLGLTRCVFQNGDLSRDSSSWPV